MIKLQIADSTHPLACCARQSYNLRQLTSVNALGCTQPCPPSGYKGFAQQEFGPFDDTPHGLIEATMSTR